MAPTVTVPTNFGRQHIGSLTHSNLTLNLKDGETSRANSLILSFNSPVILALIANLELTSLDLLEFQKTSAECFVDSLYTGDIELLQKPVFREVHKMGRVFEVVWLVGRCEGYFKELVGEMDGGSYQDMLFLYEEAEYVLTSMKERVFVDFVFQQIALVNGKHLFINSYMENYNEVSTGKLDRIIELAGADVHIVVQSLTSQFTKHLAVHGTILTENSRHLLDNCNLSVCRKTDRLGYENLFDMLQGTVDLSNEDLRWILALHRTSSQKKKLDSNPQNCPAAKKQKALSRTKIPNLFLSFEEFKDLEFDELLDRLAADVKVTNLVMVMEAYTTWFDERGSSQFPFCTKDHLDKIANLKLARGWCTVPEECITYWWRSGAWVGFQAWKSVQNRPVVAPEDQKHAQLLSCQNELRSGEQLGSQENRLMFHFKHPNTTNCTRKGKCGFILKSTPGTIENPDLFNIELCVDQQEYSAEIHLHDDLIRAEHMHLMVGDGDGYWYPISWCGKPRHNGRKWKWGPSPLNYNIRIKILYTL